jgi:hypothetical protein
MKPKKVSKPVKPKKHRHRWGQQYADCPSCGFWFKLDLLSKKYGKNLYE